MSLPVPATLAAAFGMTPDQEALRAATRAALERHAPLSVAARTGPDVDLWPALTALGLPGALVPGHLGGAGLGPADVAVVLEEAGRVLAPAPLLSTTLAVATLLVHADAPTAARVLPAVADGTTRVAVAVGPEPGSVTAVERPAPAGGPGGARTAETRPGAEGAWALTGPAGLVLDGAGADLLVVLAGQALYLVAAGPGVTAEPAPALDVTRRLADVTLTAAPATRLATGADLLAAMTDLAVVLLAAEQVGAARRALEIAVEHAGTREQFGRPVGSFQAVKHRLADMLIAVEYATSVASYAAWAAASAPDELPGLAGTLAVTVGDAFVEVTEGLIQVLGGTGCTWEHPAHLYHRRALSDRLLFGSPDALQDRAAVLLLGP